jgi:putative pyoverdin transport system ATP-binding/permease protein
MKLLSFLLRASRRTVALAVVFGLISGASSAGALALIAAALGRGRFSAAALAWSFAGLCVLMPFSRFLADFLLCRLGHEATFQLRMALSHRILAAPLPRLEEAGAPRLLAALTGDVTSVTNALLLLPLLCINAAKVLGCLVYLAWLSGPVFLLAVCFIAVGVLVYQVPLIRAARFQKLVRQETDDLYHHFSALTGGIKELKLHRRRGRVFYDQVLSRTAGSLRRHNITAMAYFIAVVSLAQVLFFIFAGVLVFVLPSFRAVSTEVIVSSTIVALYMVTPLDSIMNTLANLSSASVAIQKIEALGISLSGEPEEEAGAADAGPAWRSLELVRVTHSYRREREARDFVLGPLDLTFRPGELVFVTGGNGGGKTTLLKLLTGLYVPEAGEIRFDGQLLTKETLTEYRQNFSVVFSDFYLFESLLGLESRDLDGEARDYLAQLQLDHKVKVVDGGFSTTALSQGQRKRLALLVAYLEDRPIYVFDEWAADQDPHFKNIFYLELLPGLKAKGKTVIAITHDDSYYHLADRVIKGDNGKLAYDERAVCRAAS